MELKVKANHPEHALSIQVDANSNEHVAMLDWWVLW